MPQPHHVRRDAFKHDIVGPKESPLTTPLALYPPEAAQKAMKLPTHIWVPRSVAKSPFITHACCRHAASCTSVSSSICLQFALRLPTSPREGGRMPCAKSPTHKWALSGGAPGGPPGGLANGRGGGDSKLAVGRCPEARRWCNWALRGPRAQRHESQDSRHVLQAERVVLKFLEITELASRETSSCCEGRSCR